MTMSAMEVVYPPWGWTNWSMTQASDPSVEAWFESEDVSDIPETEVPWLLAQGWKVDGVEDDDNKPPLRKFDLVRNSFKAQEALAAILSSYTTMFNEARNANDRQYDDVVLCWSDALAKTQSHLNRMAANFNTYEVLYVNTLDSIVNQVEWHGNVIAADAVAGFNASAAQLNNIVTALAGLEPGYNEYASRLGTILTTQASSLASFISDAVATATQFVTDYNSHAAEVAGLETESRAILSLLSTDYDSRVATLATLENAALNVASQLEADQAQDKSDIRAVIANAETVVDQMETDQAGDQTGIDGLEAEAEEILELLVSDKATHKDTLDDLEATDISNLASHVSAFEAKLTQMETAAATASDELEAITPKAEDAYSGYRTQALAVVDDIDSELESLRGTADGLLTDMDTALTGHTADYEGILALMLADYETHAGLTRNLLVDFDTTEQARITERWASDLTKQKQQLVNRGFFASSLITDITTRNTRESGEQLTELRDKLNREKIEHEHRLYAELTSVRDKYLAGEVYVHSVEDNALKYRADWAARLYEQAMQANQIIAGLHGNIRSARMEVLEQERVILERTFAWAQDARKAVADGKDRVYRLRHGLQEWRANNSNILSGELQNARNAALSTYRWEADSLFKLAAELQSVRNADLDTHRWKADSYFKLAEQLRRVRESLLQLKQWQADLSVKCAGMLENVRQFSLRDYQWESDNTFKLAGELQDARRVDLDVERNVLDARNAADKFAVDARTRIIDALNKYIAQYAAGLSDYASQTRANSVALAEVRNQVIRNTMEARFKYASGLTEEQLQQSKLHQVQIDERNNMALGLFEFMGKREWEAPAMQEFGQMILAMGDAGATQWVMS